MTLPCPICAYDLSAHPRAWITACPLASPCPECGQTLHWRELLNPDRRPHPANFECGRVHILRRYLLTSLATLYPPALWRIVRPDQIPRFPRLLFLAASWPLLVHALVGVAVYMLTERYLAHPSAMGEYVPWWPWNMGVTFPAKANSGLVMPLSIVGILYLVPVVMSLLLLVPAAAVVPALRARDTLRAWLYSIPPATILIIPQLLVMAALFAFEARIAPTFGERPPIVWLFYLFAISWHVVAMSAWWRVCFHRYLHLPRPGAAAVLLLVGMIVVPLAVMIILSFA